MRFHRDGSKPPIDNKWVFVFGSNQAGIHGAGAAKLASLEYGAVWAIGSGFMKPRCYALPTKDFNIETLPLKHINANVLQLGQVIKFWGREKRWFITRVGCGLAGYNDSQIAPMFQYIADNCPNVSFPEPWRKYLSKTKQSFWSRIGIK